MLFHLLLGGIVHEVTGQRRNRVYAYRAYLDIPGEGGRPLKTEAAYAGEPSLFFSTKPGSP